MSVRRLVVKGSMARRRFTIRVVSLKTYGFSMQGTYSVSFSLSPWKLAQPEAPRRRPGTSGAMKESAIHIFGPLWGLRILFTLLSTAAEMS